MTLRMMVTWFGCHAVTTSFLRPQCLLQKKEQTRKILVDVFLSRSICVRTVHVLVLIHKINTQARLEVSELDQCTMRGLLKGKPVCVRVCERSVQPKVF